MQEHKAEALSKIEAVQRDYVRPLAGVSAADELGRLAALKDKAVLTGNEFAAQKARLLST